MPLGRKTRRRLALLVLAVWLPLYVVLAVNLVALFERPPVLVELLVYVVLGVLWVLPFRSLFRGVARPDAADEAGGKGPPQRRG